MTIIKKKILEYRFKIVIFSAEKSVNNYINNVSEKISKGAKIFLLVKYIV